MVRFEVNRKRGVQMKILSDSPLRYPAYRLFYAGCVTTALGYTMQGTLAAWTMAMLTPSAFMIGLVQTATAGPVLLFGLIAGAVADITDRRRVILTTQLTMFFAVLLLGITEWLGALTPVLLLGLTSVIGIGFAFYVPAQLTSINGLVARHELPKALALNTVAFNVARAVGPGLAGMMAAVLSTGVALLASAPLFLLMGVTAYFSKRAEVHRQDAVEGVLTGVRAGLQFTLHSATMRAVVIRNLGFSLAASAFWALLPLIAKEQLNVGADGFGWLFAAFGVGAIVSASAMSRLLGRVPVQAIATWGATGYAVAIGLISMTHMTSVVVFCAAMAGAGWVVVLTCHATVTQSSAPGWVRARAVSVYLVSTQAGLAVGGALWGMWASFGGIQVALLSSAAMLMLIQLLTGRLRFDIGTEADVTPYAPLAELSLPVEPNPQDGPVVVQLQYVVDLQIQSEFLRAMETVGPTRRRSGARNWELFRDLSDPECIYERYVVASWAEYLRQRARQTQADRAQYQAALRYQRVGIPVRVLRMIGVHQYAMTDTP
jgi:MFS family permease